ncbi:MAG TPA: DUF4129 domain-containing protein, partial [Chloroflexota bacterium]|nr:DUF4129 domain-containing protein [Chloroflexota bacterium]
PAALTALLLASAALRGALRARLRPGWARLLALVAGLACAWGAATVAWWQARGGRWPWEAGWVPLVDDALLTRGLLAGALVLAAWWRGGAVAWPRPALGRIEASFRTGATALAVLFVLAALAGSALTPALARLAAAALVTLGAGLAGMPLARVLDIRREREIDGIVPLEVGGRWGVLLGGSVLALLLASVGVVRALSAGAVGRVVGWLGAPVRLLGALVAFVEGLWNQIAAQLQSGVVGELPGAAGSGAALRGTPVPVRPVADEAGSLDWLLSVVAALAAEALVTLLLLLLTRATQRLRVAIADDDVPEERDFVWPTLEETWRAAARRLAERRRRQRRAAVEGDAGVRRVRLLYRRVQRLGSRAGRPRDDDETPREYEAALAEVQPFGARAAELDAVTALYSRVRYGEEIPDDDAVTAGERAVRRLAARG